MLLAACHEQPDPPVPTLRDVVEQSCLTLIVEVTPPEIQFGDAVIIRAAVETPEDCAVAFPPAVRLGDTEVPATESLDPRPGPRGIVWRRTYRGIPLTAGQLDLAPLTVTCTPAADAHAQPTAADKLTSRPLTVVVRSLLTAADSPANPREITGPLMPPAPPLPWWLKALLGAAFAAVLAAVWITLRAVLRWHSRRPPMPPEVWALQSLDALAAADWFRSDRIRAHYYRLTDIVRRYIELKFALAAGEMTTEEFLSALARDPHALPYDAAPLRSFLEACDAVKYAAAQPASSDTAAALATARAFIQATATASKAPSRGPAA